MIKFEQLYLCTIKVIAAGKDVEKSGIDSQENIHSNNNSNNDHKALKEQNEKLLRENERYKKEISELKARLEVN